MESKKIELAGFLALFIGLLVLTFLVFKPFILIIVLAAVLSVLFQPLYKMFVRFFYGNKSFAASIMVIIALIFLILPIIFLGLQISGQAQNLFSFMKIDQGQYILDIQQHINIFVQHFVPSFNFSISDYIDKILVFISDNFGGLLSQTTYIFFQTFLMLLALFLFLRDGDKMLDKFISFSPFKNEQNKEIVGSVDRTIISVIRGTLFVGLIRFVLITVAFYFLGIQDLVLWGSVGGIIGAVPGLGTPFVIIPAFIYFLLNGHILSAVYVMLFGALLLFFVDDLLSAYFFGKGLEVPSLFILFSILGGIMYFGPLGFIFGPIILSLFVSVVDMYKILVLKKSIQ